MTTLLERAKGSVLDIVVNYHAPPDTIVLLSPHAQNIRYLEFPYNCWTDILALSQVISGQLSLLRTLKIYTLYDDGDHDIQRSISTTPSLPLFSGSVNLEEFNLRSDGALVVSLDHFVFPNLTTFNLSVWQTDPFDASQVLDFLKASPTLRTVKVKIHGRMTPERIPQYMFVILPNVETFSLYGEDDVWHIYALATHISCPRAKCTSLTDRAHDDRMAHDLEIFPDPTSWKRIVHQYTTGPVEEVTLEIDGSWPTTTCSLTFQSSDATVIRLRFTTFGHRVREFPHEEMDLKVFSRACLTIQGLPLLSHVKRFRIEVKKGAPGVGYSQPMADQVRALFKSLGPLDKLTIHGYNLQIFLAPFVGPRDYRCSEPVFPHVQRLAISESLMVDDHQCTDDIVNLAKLQYELGRPFEHVTIRARGIPPAMAERLGQWVGAVDCRKL